MKYKSLFIAALPGCLAFNLPGTSTLRLFKSWRKLEGRASDHPTALQVFSSDDHSNASFGDKVKARTCILHFLNQRTTQSFMFLLKQFRDPHTATWLENFAESSNLLLYHGTGAISTDLFPAWEDFYTDLMDRPADIVVVEIKAAGDYNGLSKNNPYREKEGKTVEIEIDIDPPSIAGRMLSVRDKIAKEWESDLDLLIVANGKILSSYNQMALDKRVEEIEAKKQEEIKKQEIAAKKQEDIKKQKEREMQERKKNRRRKGKRRNRKGRNSNKFLKDIKAVKEDDVEQEEEAYTRVQPGAMSGDFNFGQRTVRTFERDAVYMLNNHPSFNDPESTLLRSSNFDLLFLLSTQEAIHRLLMSYRDAGEEKEVSFSWLLEYYRGSLEKYFDGNQSFGRADDFLDDLLLTPPSLKTINGNVGFIDPLAITEDIVRVREEVALDWKEIMSAASKNQEFLRQEIFLRQMAKWGQPMASNEKKSITESSSSSDSSEAKDTDGDNPDIKTVGSQTFGEFE